MPVVSSGASPGATTGATAPPRRLLGAAAGRKPPSAARIARRRWFITAVKLALPVLALAILGSMMFWQDLVGDPHGGRFSYRRGVLDAVSGQIRDPRYHGVDEHNRPYTVTALSARQSGPEKYDLVSPKADVTLENGSWLMVQSRQGVFVQHANIVDLSGDVTLYRDDGTTMITATATVDLKAGAATSADLTHVEGPFGTLDAQGFTVSDNGALARFPGPGRLVLNGGKP
jgi:lipopolysaccharide export system protein LptC